MATSSRFARWVERGSPCTKAEITEQASYLLRTPVFWLAPRIVSGEEVLWRGRIATLDDLGALETLWSDLGTVRSATPKHFLDVFDPLEASLNGRHPWPVNGYHRADPFTGLL